MTEKIKEEKYGTEYNLENLKYWDEKIQYLANEFELNCFSQEFEICDYHQMLGYLAYYGMPSHYPHWSFGKAFEKQKTLYDYGVSGLPYEMVINSNPALAYLMKNNSLLLQILTIAHVCGHNNFFRENSYFNKNTRPEYTLEMFQSHGKRIRSYEEDPSIGKEKVEQILDACHALSLNCARNLGIKKLAREEQIEKFRKKMQPEKDEFSNIHIKEEIPQYDLNQIPLEPEEDIILFIRDNNPYLTDWQRDILTMVAEETEYFIPQMEAKIMNEGWATFWHYKIINELNERGELPQGMFIEFLVYHNQVIKPVPGRINPYYLGFELFKDIYERYEKETPGAGKTEIFHAMRACRDYSFLNQYLTKELMRKMNMLSFEKKGKETIVSNISDEDGWKNVKEILLKNTGLAALPVIKILDANYRKQQMLYLLHEYDKRELELSYAQETIKYLFSLWGKRVILESRLEGKPMFFSYDGEGSVKISYQLLS